MSVIQKQNKKVKSNNKNRSSMNKDWFVDIQPIYFPCYLRNFLLKKAMFAFNTKKNLRKKSRKKNHLLFIVYFMVVAQFGCVKTTEEHIALFENYLESFMGKRLRDVVNSMGQPSYYKNRTDLPGEQSGTYMVYDYRNKGDNCIIMFKYAKSTLKIIDWDYEGNCLLLDESLFKTW